MAAAQHCPDSQGVTTKANAGLGASMSKIPPFPLLPALNLYVNSSESIGII
jgi:hypothetical protein